MTKENLHLMVCLKIVADLAFHLMLRGTATKVGTENYISLWSSSWHRAPSASQVNSHLYCNCCNLSYFLSSLSPSFHFFLLLSPSLSVFPPSLSLSPFHSFLIHIWALWESTLELKRQWKYPLKHNKGRGWGRRGGNKGEGGRGICPGVGQRIG